ncbi:MAG: hypothetical protein ACREA7_00960 [Nitrosotalea sp.]
MWKVERDSHYYKIYDKRKNVAGYFAPEYGAIYPEEKIDEVIEQMHKRHETVKSGYLMVPMVKFGIFGEDREMHFEYIIKQLDDVKKRVMVWANFIASNNIRQHKITISHTDHDMLSITFDLVFSSPLELEKNAIQNEIGKVLDLIVAYGLL